MLLCKDVAALDGTKETQHLNIKKIGNFKELHDTEIHHMALKGK